MSASPEDTEKLDLLIMEEEVKIAGAEHGKKAVLLRIAKRQSEIRRDEEHLILQDKIIEQARVDIARHRKTIKGE
jgi:hypothetical protein